MSLDFSLLIDTPWSPSRVRDAIRKHVPWQRGQDESDYLPAVCYGVHSEDQPYRGWNAEDYGIATTVSVFLQDLNWGEPEVRYDSLARVVRAVVRDVPGDFVLLLNTEKPILERRSGHLVVPTTDWWQEFWREQVPEFDRPAA